MPDAAEAFRPAHGAGYSGRQALLDLLGGARYARRPVRRRQGVPVPWLWLLLLLCVAGLASGLDVYLREPFRIADLPPAWQPHLLLVNLFALPLLNIVVLAVAALLFVAGAKVLLATRLSIGQIATAVVLGLWSAVLPILLVAGIGGGIGLSTDLVAIAICCIMLGYVAPSLSEIAGVSIRRAVVALLVGPILLAVAVAVAMLAFGFSAKIAGFRL